MIAECVYRKRLLPKEWKTDLNCISHRKNLILYFQDLEDRIHKAMIFRAVGNIRIFFSEGEGLAGFNPFMHNIVKWLNIL